VVVEHTLQQPAHLLEVADGQRTGELLLDPRDVDRRRLLEAGNPLSVITAYDERASSGWASRRTSAPRVSSLRASGMGPSHPQTICVRTHLLVLCVRMHIYPSKGEGHD